MREGYSRRKGPGSMTRYVERKVKPGGKVLEYEVDLVHRDRSVAIVRFEMKHGGGPPRLPVEVPAGSVSYGYFWPRRPYSLYRWLSPDGSVVAHRFDAVCDVHVTAEEVAYHDLVLDWWVLPDDELIEEDRDELEELLASGSITPADARRANEAAQQIFSRYRHIIDEVVDLERRWVA